jgi:hypothetical protein
VGRVGRIKCETEYKATVNSKVMFMYFSHIITEQGENSAHISELQEPSLSSQQESPCTPSYAFLPGGISAITTLYAFENITFCKTVQ